MKYERHIDGLTTSLKIGHHSEVIERGERGDVIHVHAAYDYEPSQAWIIVIDRDSVLQFHHDQTDTLLLLLEWKDGDTTKEAATLYKVDPQTRQQNVRANRRISTSVVARIKIAISENRLKVENE